MIQYVNVKKVVVLVLAISAILAGAAVSVAHPQYLTSLNTVYGDGSCGTCHIKTSGGGPLNTYGTLFQDQPNHIANASAALKAIGSPPAATTTPALTPTAVLTPSVTGTLTVTPVQTDTPTATETPAETPTVAGVTATPAAPGFGFAVSLIGLFSWALLARRHNK